MPSKKEIRAWKATGAHFTDRRPALHCLENGLVSGFGRTGAATQAILIEKEQVGFQERNEYKYCEWRKRESREIVFD